MEGIPALTEVMMMDHGSMLSLELSSFMLNWTRLNQVLVQVRVERDRGGLRDSRSLVGVKRLLGVGVGVKGLLGVKRLLLLRNGPNGRIVFLLIGIHGQVQG